MLLDANTKAKFRESTLLYKMAQVKKSRSSTEVVGLAESALSHFEAKVSDHVRTLFCCIIKFVNPSIGTNELISADLII